MTDVLSHGPIELRCGDCRARFCSVGSPRRLCDLRELASREGWAHDVVQLSNRGVSPSVDFCPECVRLKLRDEAIVLLFEAEAAGTRHG